MPAIGRWPARVDQICDDLDLGRRKRRLRLILGADCPRAVEWRHVKSDAAAAGNLALRGGQTFLEGQGFEVKGEVCGWDVVAVRPGEPPLLVITELKMALTLELVLQGVERSRAADEVWLAVRATRCGRDRDARAHRLCRMLGFGLLAVHPGRNRVEVLAEPPPTRPNVPQRRRLLKEHESRRGDPTQGVSARRPIMTAYRQQALLCAVALQNGLMRPRGTEIGGAGGWADPVP